MTPQQFFSINNGKFVEVAGSANAKNQCVDLANAYIRDVLKLPIIEWTNACDFPAKAGDKYEFIKNTPNGIPNTGDIIVWKASKSLPVGHIAIVSVANIDEFISFDQNWPIGSACHFQEHSYTGVDGWLRAKGQVTPQAITSDDDSRALAVLKEGFKRSNKSTLEEYARGAVGAEELVPKLDRDKKHLELEIEDIEDAFADYMDEHEKCTPVEKIVEKTVFVDLPHISNNDLFAEVLRRLSGLWKTNSNK